MKQSKAITLPPTQPKPRKEDIINALVERARVQHAQEAKVLAERHEKAKRNIEEEAARLLDEQRESLTPSYDIPWKHSNFQGVTITIKVQSPRLKTLIQAYHAVPSLRLFDEQAVKKQIREKSMASKDERTKALLANPDAVKALDAMLKEMI